MGTSATLIQTTTDKTSIRMQTICPAAMQIIMACGTTGENQRPEFLTLSILSRLAEARVKMYKRISF
jgi:hypothetical protein